jgi:hypothetical protein
MNMLIVSKNRDPSSALFVNCPRIPRTPSGRSAFATTSPGMIAKWLEIIFVIIAIIMFLFWRKQQDRVRAIREGLHRRFSNSLKKICLFPSPAMVHTGSILIGWSRVGLTHLIQACTVKLPKKIVKNKPEF